MAKVLVACETSGVVRVAFLARSPKQETPK